MTNSRSIKLSPEASLVYDELLREIADGEKIMGRAFSHDLIALGSVGSREILITYKKFRSDKKRESNKNSKLQSKAKKSAIEDLNRICSQYGEDFVMDAIA
jgi:hypothetical protein